MQRMVYCPSDSQIDEAGVLSKKTLLPILIGDNDNSINLKFNRNIVQIISVPDRKTIKLSHEIVEIPFHQNITYCNEFDILKNNIKLYINASEVKPLYEEKHRVQWNYSPTEVGVHECIIYISNIEKERFYFDAYK